MIKRYEIREDLLNDVDDALFESGLDDHVWFEEQNKYVVTDNELVIEDLEKLLSEVGVEVK